MGVGRLQTVMTALEVCTTPSGSVLKGCRFSFGSW